MSRLNKQNISRALSYYKRNGVRELIYKARERLARDEDENDYTAEVISSRLSLEEREAQRRYDFIHRYKISLIVPAYETDKRHIRQMMQSVADQTYDNWELCIADGSRSNVVCEAVKEFSAETCERTAGKIKYQRLEDNYGISGNTNRALSMAEGEYIGLLDHDDLLTEDALFTVVKYLQDGLVKKGNVYSNRIMCLYSDEDKVNDDLTHYFDLHKKPDFDMDLLCTNNYVCHFFVARTEIALRSGFKDRYNGAQDHDFILRCVEKLNNNSVCHIDKVLYHWRSSNNSTAENPDSKLYAYEAGKFAIEDHFKRIGLNVEVIPTKHLGFYTVKYRPLSEKVYTVSRSKWDKMSSKDIAGISKEYIMILADDLKAEKANYLDDLSGCLARFEVGCVGGKIIDSRGNIESVGYERDANGSLVPCFAGLNRHFSGYLHRASLWRRVDAVSLDCMLIKKQALTEDKSLSPEYIVVVNPDSVFVRKH